jgi:adenylate kinase family enzyme
MIKLKFMKTVFTIIFLCISVSAQDTTDQKERQKIIEEYQQISSRLMELQRQALSDIKIAEQAENFSRNLEEAMVQEDSSVLMQINRREEIIEQFEETGNNDNKTTALNLQQEYQEITQNLMVYQQRVLTNNEGLREEGDKLEKALFEKMKELDPGVPELVARLETLGSKIHGLEVDKQL